MVKPLNTAHIVKINEWLRNMQDGDKIVRHGNDINFYNGSGCWLDGFLIRWEREITMGAPNFALLNTKRYFIIEEPENAEFWFWNDVKEQLADKAVELGFEWLENDEYRKQVGRKSNICRDYCAEALPVYFQVERKDKFDGLWRATLVPLVRNGYYANANLDFYIVLRTEYGEDLENEDALNKDVISEVICDYFDYLRDYENTETTAGDMADLMDLIDDVLAGAIDKFYEWADKSGVDEYVKAWQASNGEAAYTNISEIKRKAKQQWQTFKNFKMPTHE